MANKVSRQRYLFSGPGTYYIDLFKSLSAQERRLVRQGQVAKVMGGLIKDSNNESVVRMNVAPDTWVTRTAWRRGKKMWDMHIKEALEGMDGRLKPKYHDYKVYLNNVMGGSPVLPVDAAGNTIPSGEWGYSEYHSEDIDWADPNLLTTSNREADSFSAALVGEHSGSPADWTRIGLIKSWIESRAFNDDFPQGNVPNTVETDPLNNLFDEADAADEVITMLRTLNEEAPYDEDTHFGNGEPNAASNNLQRVAFAATQTGAGQISAMNGFSAICGLVEVVITQGVGSGQVELLLDVSTKGEKI